MLAFLAFAALGPQVLVLQTPGAESFSAQVFVRVGSAYEPKETPGISHLLEHLLFRDGGPDAQAEGAGCYLNATTYREVMRFTCDGPISSWRDGVRALASLLEPLPSSADIAKESGVIAQELALQKLDPATTLNETLYAALGGPYGPSPMGSTALMKVFSLDLVLVWQKRFFNAGNMVIVIAGNLPRDCEEVCKAYFDFLPPGDSQGLSRFPAAFPASASMGDSFAFSFPAPGIDKLRDYAPYLALSELLTSEGGIAARAGLRCRFFLGPSEGGSLANVIFQPGDERKCRKFLAEFAPAISQADFDTVKARLLAQHRARLLSPRDAATMAGFGRALGGIVLESRLSEALSALTIEDVKAAANSMRPKEGG